MAPGLPLTSYLVRGGSTQSNFTPGFAKACNSAIYLRTLEEGMEGVVGAALAARAGKNLQPHPAWERFANGFGAWLLAHQNKDGSFYRAFTPSGEVFSPPSAGCEPPHTIVDGASKLSTTFPIRYLVMMYVATGDERYKSAAERAGWWSLENIYGPMAFVGGVENYNYLDRSSAIEAMNAALALHDMELLGGNAAGADIWRAAAQRAANYAETWMYAYDFPIRDMTQAAGGKPAGRYSDYVRAGTRATSIIVTGASQGDIDLSIASFEYFRLYVLGGGSDRHDLGLAQLLEDNTKLTTQLPPSATTIDQQFGYAYNGLVTEAIGLANMGFSTQDPYVGYLAWLTNAELDPAARFEDVFGDFDVGTITGKNSLSTLEVRDARIYPAPGSLGWTDVRFRASSPVPGATRI